MRSIEFKIIISIIIFTLFIVGLERYQLSKSITEQFISSKKSKNDLLVNTITPILSLNFSLGLESANREYLKHIQEQNKDLELIRLLNVKNELIYEYHNPEKKNDRDKNDYNYVKREIKDDFTQVRLATLELKFSNIEYENMLKVNREITIRISIMTIILLTVFVIFMKHMFKNLKELRDSVLKYNPKRNNFPLGKSNKIDEVSLIRNAIITMVEKITVYTEILDNTNALLEEKVKQRTLELEKSNRELKLLASVDPLTTLYNRRYFTKTSSQILEISKRDKIPLSIIMFDIDNFKYINDTYGHQSGDEIIVSVASVLMNMTRKSDIVCRFGGEEFIILLPKTDLDGAYTIAEKIRLVIKEKEIHTQEKQMIAITVSVGVAEFNQDLDDSLDSIIKKADDAMYEAKVTGKNLTCIRK
jgi:diguanylate cyclase (GGDEF)-like protein